MSTIRDKNAETWPEVSPRVMELLRQGAEVVLNVPAEWLDELDEVTLSAEGFEVRDPVLIAITRKSNRLNILHWAAENIKSPGIRVEPHVGPEMITVARDLVRRGATESVLHAFRAGQNIAWRRWMMVVFELTNDPAELKELLEVSSRSISHFIDSTIIALREQMARQREAQSGDIQADLREVIGLILNYAPISQQVASQRLGYRLDQMHRAMIIWSDGVENAEGALEKAVQVCCHSSASKNNLAVVVDSCTRWVWCAGQEFESDQLREAIERLSGIRVAIGMASSGMEGFRNSHKEAVTTQHIMSRAGLSERLVSFEMVRLISLLTREEGRIKGFLRDTLGRLLEADPVLHKSLYVFLETGCNAARAAQILGLHRNTLNRHIIRAEELLPRPLDECRIQVSIALEIIRWMPEPR